MSRTLHVAFVLFLIPVPAFAQPVDGTVISRQALSVPDDAPGHVKAAAAKVTLERIIYASDGLEVEGYIARPIETDGEKLPCVIMNRGGNRSFGELSPMRAASMMGRLALLRVEPLNKHAAAIAAVGSQVPTPILRIDLASGEREPWLELSPVDPAGVFVVDRIHLSDDGRAYVFSDRKVLSNVAVMGGLE